MGSEWCFQDKHVAGVANTLADGISGCEPAPITDDLREFRPDIHYQEQVLGPAGDAV